MKKIIVHNDEHFYEAKYIISRKKYVHYLHFKGAKVKQLCFFKNDLDHRPCNIKQSSVQNDGNIKTIFYYKENGKFHNLYGPAYINKFIHRREYLIYDRKYSEKEFYNYISIYNNLSYKRSY